MLSPCDGRGAPQPPRASLGARFLPAAATSVSGGAAEAGRVSRFSPAGRPLSLRTAHCVFDKSHFFDAILKRQA